MIIQTISKAAVCITLNDSYTIDLTNKECYVLRTELNQEAALTTKARPLREPIQVLNVDINVQN